MLPRCGRAAHICGANLILRFGIPIMSRRQIKVFWSSNFSKMLARCGRVAHICEANCISQFVFPAAIAFFETVKFVILWFIWNKLQIRTRQRGNCSMLAGKSRGGTPFCRMWKTVFSKRSSPRETTRIRFGRIASLSAFVLFAGGYVVRICYEFFLDSSFPEFFMFLGWRTAFTDFF